jgi:hypothetical protein
LVVGDDTVAQLKPGIAFPEESSETTQDVTATGSVKPSNAVDVRPIGVGLNGSARLVFGVLKEPCVRVIAPGVTEDEKF